MTVARLIEQLRTMPQDADVVVAGDITLESPAADPTEIDGAYLETWSIQEDPEECGLVLIAAIRYDDDEE